MTDFGPCQHPGCTREAVVGLNKAFVCLEHFEARLAAVRETILLASGLRRMRP